MNRQSCPKPSPLKALSNVFNLIPQALLVRTKKTAMDLMFLADEADQQASKEAAKLKGMQSTPSQSESAMFDRRASQRRVWMSKSELALKVTFGNGHRRCRAQFLPLTSVFLVKVSSTERSSHRIQMLHARIRCRPKDVAVDHSRHYRQRCLLRYQPLKH